MSMREDNGRVHERLQIGFCCGYERYKARLRVQSELQSLCCAKDQDCEL